MFCLNLDSNFLYSWLHFFPNVSWAPTITGTISTFSCFNHLQHFFPSFVFSHSFLVHLTYWRFYISYYHLETLYQSFCSLSYTFTVTINNIGSSYLNHLIALNVEILEFPYFLFFHCISSVLASPIMSVPIRFPTVSCEWYLQYYLIFYLYMSAVFVTVKLYKSNSTLLLMWYYFRLGDFARVA